MNNSYPASASCRQFGHPALVSLRPLDGVPGKRVSAFIAGGACVFLALALCALFARYQHWFMIPVTLCGVLVTSDALSLLKTKRRIYEPAVLMSVYGIYFFFVAPLLHVYYGYWLIYAQDAPDDWRPWLARMACFNFIGLVIYKWVRDQYMRRSGGRQSVRQWVPRYDVLAAEFLIALLVSAACQVWVYAKFGGINSFISTFKGQTSENFAGLGFIFSVADTFPIFAFIALCIFVLSRRRRVSMGTIAGLLGIVLVLSVIFGGLRGSRTLIVGNVLWAAGIVHFTLRPLTKRVVLFGLCAIVVFMYAYGFYKDYGLQGMDYLFSDSAGRARAGVRTGRTTEGLLLGDLGRSGIQAYTLYRLGKSDSDYQYAWGTTYLGAASLFIPKQFRPTNLVTTNRAGMQMAYGQDSYIEGSQGATYVYGLAGEAMLNFTPWAIPLSFGALGVLVGYVQKWFGQLPRGDLRWYIAPPIAILTLSALTGSSDNLLYAVCTTLLLPWLILLLGAKQLAPVRPPFSQGQHIATVMPARRTGLLDGE